MSIAKLAIFAGGMLFGTAGLKILGSRDAKKVYAHTTAAVIRAKDSVMETVSTLRENADDVLADARAINAERAADAEVIEDCCCCKETDAGDGASCCCGEAEEASDEAAGE